MDAFVTGGQDCRILVWDLQEVAQLYGAPPEAPEPDEVQMPYVLGLKCQPDKM